MRSVLYAFIRNPFYYWSAEFIEFSSGSKYNTKITHTIFILYFLKYIFYYVLSKISLIYKRKNNDIFIIFTVNRSKSCIRLKWKNI